jgi:hypothetical protein
LHCLVPQKGGLAIRAWDYGMDGYYTLPVAIKVQYIVSAERRHAYSLHGARRWLGSMGMQAAVRA